MHLYYLLLLYNTFTGVLCLVMCFELISGVLGFQPKQPPLSVSYMTSLL